MRSICVLVFLAIFSLTEFSVARAQTGEPEVKKQTPTKKQTLKRKSKPHKQSEIFARLHSIFDDMAAKEDILKKDKETPQSEDRKPASP